MCSDPHQPDRRRAERGDRRDAGARDIRARRRRGRTRFLPAVHPGALMAGPLTDRVVISGIGQSDIGRRLGRDPLQLTADACIAAVSDAGLSLADIDGLTTYPGASMAGKGFSGAGLRDIHDALGLKLNWVAGGVEYPGQLGAVVDAMLAVAGGMANHVLCWRSIWEGTAQGSGRRKGYTTPPGGRPTGQLGWQLPYGVSAANLAGLQIRARMQRFGLTREQLGQIA